VKVNEYGMTFDEWHNTATFGTRRCRKFYSLRRLRKAWRAGECPNDYCLEWQTPPKVEA